MISSRYQATNSKLHPNFQRKFGVKSYMYQSVKYGLIQLSAVVNNTTHIRLSRLLMYKTFAGRAAL